MKQHMAASNRHAQTKLQEEDQPLDSHAKITPKTSRNERDISVLQAVSF